MNKNKCDLNAYTYSSFKDSELLTIFPNPASDYLIIEYLQMDSGEDYQISIYNNFGQLVLSQSY